MAILTQGPDPYPKRPRLALPPGACDTHIHLFGPAGKYPFAPDSPYTSRDALPETYMALQDTVGLSRAVIVSGGGYGRNYQLMADTLARFPDRFRGVALMPDDTDSAEFARLSQLGVRGLRMISEKRGGHLPTYSREVAARAHEHGWHVQFYPHGTDIIDYADKLLALPNVIVLDHFASVPAAGGTDQPAFKAVLRMLDSGRVVGEAVGADALHAAERSLPRRDPARARAGAACAGAPRLGQPTGRTSISTAARCRMTATSSISRGVGARRRPRESGSLSTTPARSTASHRASGPGRRIDSRGAIGAPRGLPPAPC